MSDSIVLSIFGGERCIATRAALEGAARRMAEKRQRQIEAAKPPPNLITYPARPIQGGRLELAPPKRGVWFAEPKFNGWRALVHTPSSTMWNRHGSKLTIAHCFKDALDELRDLADEGLIWADCEALERRHQIARGTLIVLDAIPHDPSFTPTYTERREFLESLCIPQEPFSRGIHEGDTSPLLLTTSRMVCDQNESLAFYCGLRQANHGLHAEFFEGVVMKRADAVYPVQLRSSTEETPCLIKHRFIT
jgi:ATP-dependent DNA ligase